MTCKISRPPPRKSDKTTAMVASIPIRVVSATLLASTTAIRPVMSAPTTITGMDLASNPPKIRLTTRNAPITPGVAEWPITSDMSDWRRKYRNVPMAPEQAPMSMVPITIRR